MLNPGLQPKGSVLPIATSITPPPSAVESCMLVVKAGGRNGSWICTGCPRICRSIYRSIHSLTTGETDKEPAGQSDRRDATEKQNEEFHFSDSLENLREMRFNPHEVTLNQTSENLENSKFHFSNFSNVQSHFTLSYLFHLCGKKSQYFNPI